MYCKYCKVNVETADNVCPLCKNPLEGQAAEYPPFPKKVPRKNRRPVTAKGIYAAIMLPILLICIILNVVLPHRYIWAGFVAIATLFGYYTLKTTIFYKGPGGAKVFSQTLMWTILFISIQYIFKTVEWAFSFGIPILIMSLLAAHLVFYGVFHKKKGSQFMRYMWLTALIGVLPAIMVAAGICNWPYLAYACLIVSALTLLALLIFTGQTIAGEVKKKSHI